MAAFACGIIGIAATGIAGFVWLVGWLFTGEPAGSGSDMFNTDPATNHAHLITALEIGGVTIALFALAVLLGVVEVRRSGQSLRPIRMGLIVAAVTGVAAVVLESFPATFHLCVVPGVVCAASLISCFAAIGVIRRRAQLLAPRHAQ